MTTGARYLLLVPAMDPGTFTAYGPWDTKPKAEAGMARKVEEYRKLGEPVIVTLVKILSEQRLGARS